MTRYILHDTYGAPQCGTDVTIFDEWFELDYFLDDNPDVIERIEQGYAWLTETYDEALTADTIYSEVYA